jgi:DNA-binding FadR family transcriptional regulator
MGLMNSLSRPIWFLHFRQAADLPVTARLHADLGQAIADGDEARAANMVDALFDSI